MSRIDLIKELINKESKRQESEICLIASENYMSKDVMEASGSVLVNKYAEGYPSKRYYGGCHIVDEIEQIAIDEAKELFKCNFANVQPHSGSQANQAVYLALLKPGDTVLGMSLNEGGHLSHGSKVSSSGKIYNAIQYGIDENGIINYEEIKQKLYEHHPKLLIVGASAYPREIDFKKIREIIDEYNADLPKEIEHKEVDIESYAYHLWSETIDKCYFMVDMAHIAGLVAVDEHMSPIPYADVVTSTTQKTLRSGRGGLILTNDEDIAKKIDKAVFPGIQGGPLEHIIAGKAIGFAEALQPEFKTYIQQVKKNIQAMVKIFKLREVDMISDGSDNHLILLDLRNKGISGKQLEKALEEVGIITNKNAVKDDPLPKTETSGLRIGTAAITTRGANEEDCEWLAHKICDVIDIITEEYDYDGIQLHKTLFEQRENKELTLETVAMLIIKEGVERWCLDYPIYK